MRDDASMGAARLRRWLRSRRSRAIEDPPTHSALALTYIITLAVLAAAVLGSGALLSFSTWASSQCLPSGRPLTSSASVTVAILVLGAVLVAYCLGCATYLWSTGAAAIHSRVWVGIALVVLAVVIWALATVHIQPCRSVA
jgi:hypothetical protein